MSGKSVECGGSRRRWHPNRRPSSLYDVGSELEELNYKYNACRDGRLTFCWGQGERPCCTQCRGRHFIGGKGFCNSGTKLEHHVAKIRHPPPKKSGTR